MNKILITFRSIKSSLSIEISTKDQENMNNFIFAFFRLFPGVDFASQTIDSLHQNTKDLMDSINSFVDEHKKQEPSLNKIAAFFNRMTENEWFYFIPFKRLTQEEDITIVNYLVVLSNPVKDFETLQREFSDLFGDLISNYIIYVFGPERKNIGEPDKKKRLCRFCNNNREPVTFNNRAHAISEALGNKTITLYDECDGCNSFFSQQIEQDLIEYLSLFRTLYEIKGKGGQKAFIGSNFELRKEDKVTLKFESEDNSTDADLPMKIPLRSNKSISHQNIYRTLCKYFLSVIPAEYLVHFDETIQWINGAKKIENLPKIASRMFYDKLAEQPQLTIYLRKNDDYSLPFAVCELHFTLLRYVFIVPGCNRDKSDFLGDSGYKEFWNRFKHFQILPDWIFEDFSNDVRKPFVINLKIKLNPDSAGSGDD